MRLFASVCLLLLLPGKANAAWLQASSAHFVVYADDTERNIRRFSEQLERYHAAMEVVTDTKSPAPSPSNRVTVFVVSNEREVRKLYGDKDNKYLGGFYLPRAGGSLAIVPRVTAASSDTLDRSMVVLLHEYAHHVLISASSFPRPRWMSEGAAEFFASASFERDGGVSLGRPAQHRAAELFLARDVEAAELLDPDAYKQRKRGSYDAFYGKSWLLYHYLTFCKERQGQMSRYLRLLMEGKSSRESAQEAFGNFDTLEDELESYLNKPRMLMLKLPASMLQIGQIDVRRLSGGEAAIMPVRIRSRRGVTEEMAAQLLPEARQIAAQFPGDPAVLAALAEAEHDAGNDAEAIAAADAALAIDPSQVNAYVQKGLSLFRMAADAKDSEAAYKKARVPFVALNRLENDHPLPLIYYYNGFVQQGEQPSQLARDGLQRAVDVAPFDLGLRMMLATEQVRLRQMKAARANLAPVAYSPHGGSLSEAAQRVITRIDSDPAWDGSDLNKVMAPPEDNGGNESPPQTMSLKH